MNIIQRTKKILFEPSKEWEVIKTETISIPYMFTNYALVLVITFALANYLLSIPFGFLFFGGSLKQIFLWGLIVTIVPPVLSLVLTFLFGIIIDLLAPAFESKRNLTCSMKTAVFSMTPIWISFIFGLEGSFLGWIYFLFLLYGGLKSVKEVPGEKLRSYFLLLLLITIVLAFGTNILMTISFEFLQNYF
jgi:hypothetical protein